MGIGGTFGWETETMTDTVFGELEKDDRGWIGKLTIDFGGNPYTVDLWIRSAEENESIDIPKEAFQRFMEKWPQLQEKLIDALIKYYNEEERFSYGPDDEEESAEWWPEIETREALLQAVTLEGIVIRSNFIMKGERRIYLLFSRAWGGEDYDDNGIGVRYIDEELDEIAYKDIAF